MILTTNIPSYLTDREATNYFKSKATYYLKNMINFYSSESIKWNKHLKQQYGLNLIAALIRIINSTTLTSFDNKLVIKIDDKYSNLYKNMLYGSLDIGRTELLNDMFRYALGGM